MKHFTDNLHRLLGLHDVTAKEAAVALDMSQSAFAKWATGQRNPSFETAMRIGDYFGIAADRLARAPFDDLLANELADRDRFHMVETNLKRLRLEGALAVSGLRAVADDIPEGTKARHRRRVIETSMELAKPPAIKPKQSTKRETTVS